MRKSLPGMNRQGFLYNRKEVFIVKVVENQIFDGWSKEEQETFVRLNQRYLNELKSKISELENYGG